MTNKKTTEISGVPILYQYPELPTGCEATALTMLLNWAGVNTNKHAVVTYLSKGEHVHFVKGKKVGANPNHQFVGDPYHHAGCFGVFEGPILDVIDLFLPGKHVDLTGQPFTALIKSLKSGRPVLVWTTLKQRQTYHSDTWQDRTGEIIYWYTNEHAVIMTGVTADYIIVHDPDTGDEEYYDRDVFIRNWRSMGKRAVTLDM